MNASDFITDQPVIFVSGPTASGKSDVAIKLAERFNGEVVNIDSVQIYRGMDIGSATVTGAEMCGIPHHLINYLSPGEQGNAAKFIEKARSCIEQLQASGKQVILAGGTTMYITGLLHGFARLPEREDSLREALEALPTEELWARLEQVDSGSALKLHRNDRVRIVRAIEASEISGKPYSELVANHNYQELRYPGVSIVLCRRRDDLYERINQRTKKMLEGGLIEETAAIIQRFSYEAPPLATLGYAQACAYLRGDLSGAELEGQIAQQTRRFAKRQMTFWRNEPAKRGWSVTSWPEYESVVLADDSGNNRQKGPQRKGFKVYRLSFSELCSEINKRFVNGSAGHEVWYVDAALIE